MVKCLTQKIKDIKFPHRRDDCTLHNLLNYVRFKHHLSTLVLLVGELPKLWVQMSMNSSHLAKLP